MTKRKKGTISNHIKHLSYKHIIIKLLQTNKKKARKKRIKKVEITI
jgi:hypothetical protein